MLVHYMSHENIIAILSVLISAIVSFLSDAVCGRDQEFQYYVWEAWR